jgi:hypothetical protein
LISSFHNGYLSKSATIPMISSAGAATSTVVLTNGIAPAYRSLTRAFSSTERFRETQFGEIPTPRLADGTAVRQLIRFD